MYRVLIVEDEKLVRLGLKNSIDWAKYDMYVINDVSNGLAAMKVYEEECPHVVITDLKMPIMDGMELISRIRERDSKTRIVILSCVEDFELTRTAMNYGVSGYILKLTMTDEEMDSVLHRLQKELGLQEKDDFNTQAISSGINLLKDAVFKDFVLNYVDSETEFVRKVKEFKINIMPGIHNVALMEIDHYTKLKHLFKNENGQIIKNMILNVIRELVDNNDCVEAFNLLDTQYVFLFSIKDNCSANEIDKEILTVLKRFSRSMENLFNISVSFGVSSSAFGYNSLKALYYQAEKSLENKFYNGSGIYFFHDGINKENAFKSKSNVLLHLVDLLGQTEEQFRKKCEDKLASIMNTIPESAESVQELLGCFLHWVTGSLHVSTDVSAHLFVAYNNAVSKCETIDEIMNALEDFFIGIRVNKKKRMIVNQEVLRAIDFIHDNYNQDLSLKQVAHHINLSTNYFSLLFKNELEMNYSDYLNDLRIDKAKQLLMKTNLKSYEIAEKVGYHDNTYFSKVFKRYMGMNTSDFRKQHCNEWWEGIHEKSADVE